MSGSAGSRGYRGLGDLGSVQAFFSVPGSQSLWTPSPCFGTAWELRALVSCPW